MLRSRRTPTGSSEVFDRLYAAPVRETSLVVIETDGTIEQSDALSASSGRVGGSPERAEDLLRRAAEAHDPAPTAAQLSEARQLLDSAQTRPAETYGRPLPAVS
jgi:hypothetical protein